MGTWGTGIFDDDTAADVRDDFRELIASGLSETDAVVRMESHFLDPSIRKGIEPLFWLALALTQWEIGRLDEQTKRRAIEVIDSGADLSNWQAGASPSDVALRSKVLISLRSLLETPQKPRKKLRPRKKHLSAYKVGDVISFKLSSGRFVLFRITSIATSRDGEDPVAEVLDWAGTSFPQTAELAEIPCRQRIKPGAGFTSVRFPRILLAEFPGMKIDRSRLSVIASGLPTPPSISEGYTFHPFELLEKALADEFGLE